MALTTFAANELLDHLFSVTSYTMPANIYIGLFTSAPTDAYTSGSPTGTEVSGSAYARVEILATMLVAAASRAITTDEDITFAAASGGNWGTITHVGIFDASTNGNLLWWSALTASKTVNDGDIFEITAGNFDAAFSAS